MKRRMIMLGLFIIVLLAGCSGDNSNSVLNADNSNQTEVTEERIEIVQPEKQDLSLTLSELKGPYDATDDVPFLKSVKMVAETMVENGCVYDTSGIKKSMAEALDSNRHSDCAHLICWALQDQGILEKDQTFYSKTGGVLSYRENGPIFKELMANGQIIETGGIPGSDQQSLKKVLKIGDICCYSYHMNVVAGLDEDGNILYYDAGLTPVEGHVTGGRFTEQLITPYKRPNMRNTLYTIIRLQSK